MRMKKINNYIMVLHLTKQDILEIKNIYKNLNYKIMLIQVILTINNKMQ